MPPFGRSDGPGGRIRPATPAAGRSLLALALVIGIGAALGLPPPQPCQRFIDSAGYLDLASGRAPLPGLFFALAGTGAGACLAQSLLSLTAWSWCGWTLLGAAGAGLGGALALAAPLAQWNCAVLSESLALSAAAAALGASVTLARRWTPARAAAWIAALALLAAARIEAVVLVPFLALPVLGGRSRRQRLALGGGAVLVVAAALLWAVTMPGERERAQLRLTSIVLDRVLVDPAMEAFFVARGMPVEPGLAAYRGQAARALPLFDQQAFRRDTPGLQAWLAGGGTRVYARWLLTAAPHRAVLAALPARGDPAAGGLAGYGRGIVLRPLSAWLAGPFTAAAPPPWLWAGLALVPLAAAAARRRLAPLDLLAPCLALGAYALAFAGYHGDAIEVDRHLLLARVLYRAVPWLALAAVLDRTNRFDILARPAAF